MSDPSCNRVIHATETCFASQILRGKSEEHNLGHWGTFWEVETAEQDSEG